MKNSIKRSLSILLLATAVFATTGAKAQMKTAYFMEGSIQRLDMNAAFVPQRGYVNIPGIGNLGLGYGSNFLSVRNLLYPNPDGSGLVTFMHSSVDADKFLRRMRNKNHFDIDLRENLFGFGGFARRYFWSFNVNLRSETSITIPKRFFSLAKEMQEGEYNLDNFHASTDNYLEFAFGAALPVYRGNSYLLGNINAGARVKVLVGAAHADLNVDNMRVNINDEEWRAQMRGTLTGNLIGFDFSKLSGKTSIEEIQNYLEESDFSAKQIGSWGLAFDLGADARMFDDRLKVSLGLNDLGFIVWSKKSAVNGTFDDLELAFRGYDLDTQKELFDNPEDIEMNLTTPHASTRMLTATLNLGGEYTFLENAIGLGLLSQTRFYGNYTSTELTVSANFRPSHWFSASLSHSLIHNRMGAFGLALNVHPSWINFFVGMDYIGFNYAKYESFEWIPRNLKSVNVYFGLAIPITKPKPHGSFPVTLPQRGRNR